MNSTTPTGLVKPHELAERSGSCAQETRRELKATQDPSVAKRAAQTPPKCRAAYLRAVQGKASPRAATKAFCLECVGWQREEVAHCTAPACPLYAYRSFRR